MRLEPKWFFTRAWLNYNPGAPREMQCIVTVSAVVHQVRFWRRDNVPKLGEVIDVRVIGGKNTVISWDPIRQAEWVKRIKIRAVG